MTTNIHSQNNSLTELVDKRQFSHLCQLTIIPLGRKLLVQKNKNLMDILVNETDSIRFECGGNGTCGKCRVIILDQQGLSPLSDIERKMLSAKEIQAGLRLACQTKVLDDVVVQLPDTDNHTHLSEIKFLLNGKYSQDAAVKRIFINGSKISQNQKQIRVDVQDSLKELIKVQSGLDVALDELSVLRQLSRPSIVKGKFTLVVHFQKGATSCTAGLKNRSLGVAVDIGTTTLAIYLCDLGNGEILTSASSANPQRNHGHDVLSRIDFAKRDNHGLKTLKKLVLKAVNDLIVKGLKRIEADNSEIDEIVIVGNPTMQHIFAGLHPHSLSSYPFKPFTYTFGNYRSRDLNLIANPGVNTFIFPVTSGYIGGDTLAAILADNIHKRDEITLLLDIGTNGELVLGNRHNIWTTSCATGPAMEGASISCGMPAQRGAIYSVTADPRHDSLQYRFFGQEQGVKPSGICGSGILDSVAAMLSKGLIDKNGRIRQNMPGVLSENGSQKTTRYILVPDLNSATGNAIFISSKDVRQIQLAKAALNTGITLLCYRSCIKHIDRLILTGSFGSRINPDSAFTLGIFPEHLMQSKVNILDNAAGMGALNALLDKKKRLELEKISSDIHNLELATDKLFNDEFCKQLQFCKH